MIVDPEGLAHHPQWSDDSRDQCPEWFMSPEASQASGALYQSTIQRILPHRYPFLLVDRVIEFVPGERIVGIKNFSADEFGFEGHFPGAPVAPAGILIEMVTQLGAILVLDRAGMADKVAVILHIPSARMLQPVEPGDMLRVEAEVVRLREDFGELRGAAYRQGELVAEGRMRFALANAADFLPGRVES